MQSPPQHQWRPTVEAVLLEPDHILVSVDCRIDAFIASYPVSYSADKWSCQKHNGQHGRPRKQPRHEPMSGKRSLAGERKTSDCGSDGARQTCLNYAEDEVTVASRNYRHLMTHSVVGNSCISGLVSAPAAVACFTEVRSHRKTTVGFFKDLIEIVFIGNGAILRFQGRKRLRMIRLRLLSPVSPF